MLDSPLAAAGSFANRTGLLFLAWPINRGQKGVSLTPRLLAKKCSLGLQEASSPRDKTAARYGMSESNVKISIHRGLKALASFIGRDSDE